MSRNTGTARRHAAMAVAAAVVGLQSLRANAADRVLGVDVSDYQNQNPTKTPIDWPTVAKPVSHGGGGISFAFIRATRGGTTGTYDELARTGTLSSRYDDFAFEYNINSATAAGVLSGPYHFGKPDILTNAGADEANHMLEVAGPYMKPGYLRPVYDLEAGAAQRDTASLSQFAVDFANRIHEVKGIWPIVYCGGNYANNELNSTVPATYKDLWIPRWPASPDPLHDDPPGTASLPNIYGVWNPTYPATPDPQPWKFWQYTSQGHPAGIVGDSGFNTDLDVAHGDIEFLKDFLVPALWTKDAGGSWTTISNWNTDADPSGKGTAARLPGPNDNIVLDRPTANVAITIASGQNIVRKLENNETLAITGGSLAVKRSATGTGSIIVSGGSLATPSLRQGSLSISNTGSVVVSGDARLGTLSISGSGKLDLKNNDLVVSYSGASPFSTIRKYVTSGFHTYAYPTATGIVSSTGQSGNGHQILALFDNALVGAAEWPPGSGATVSVNSVIGNFTYFGDATLDGEVSSDDYGVLDANFGTTPDVRIAWMKGDMNYDGVVTVDDYAITDANFGRGAFPLTRAAMAVAVPEPALAGLAVLAAFFSRRAPKRE